MKLHLSPIERLGHVVQASFFIHLTILCMALLAGCTANPMPDSQLTAEEKPTVSDTNTNSNANDTSTSKASADSANTATAGAASADATATTELATLGGGCFWCIEAVFQQMEGVQKVESGYSGGHVVNPSYEEVCSKTTGHAEVCQIRFDPKKVSFEELLEVFWKVHDPTTPNRQGADIGPQYRSVIFYHNDKQKELAEKYKAKLDAAGAFDKPIVTEISPLKNFYKAEDYHQNYYRLNPNQGYCRVVVRPKVEKFREVFPEKVKKSE